ncbi:hypothetical protein D0T23_30455 [Duganella sp. BJB475]|nr:hypothetical protein D0T23_30455 [Duganella sp. BJB475]
MTDQQQRSSARAAGLAIAAATILSTIFVALDQGASGTTPQEIMTSMVAMRAMKSLVHTVAIASVLAYAFGYASLATRLDLRRPLVLGSLTTYLIGCVAMIGATTLDGFVSGDLAAIFAGASPDGVKQGYNMITFTGVALTEMARVGWVLQAIAGIGWSLVLLGGRGLQRGIGLLGLLSGALVVGTVVVVGVNMDLAAILSILVAQAVWNLAAAFLLVRNKFVATVHVTGGAALAA